MKVKLNNSLYILVLCFFISACSSEKDQFKQGEVLYQTHCQSCHMEDGTGLGANIPPLAVSDYLKERQNKIACIIRNGIKDTITVNGTVYSEQMLGIPQLSEFEITNIINFINHAWGNDYGYVKATDIQQQLKACE